MVVWREVDDRVERGARSWQQLITSSPPAWQIKQKKSSIKEFLFHFTSFSYQHHGEYFLFKFCLLDSYANQI
jgi:hypothetical protein